MKKIVLIGASNRVGAFVNALKNKYANTHRIVAVMDIDPGKIAGFCKIHQLYIPTFTDFEDLCNNCEFDLAIVSSVDSTHSQYIVKLLNKKIDCICEKPICINSQQCQDIIEAHNANLDVDIITSHNSRYRPVARKLRELIDSGVIGKVLSLNYFEMLDRVHGKSYFRRWNARRKFSNGLQLHKSSHHFDKMNFFLRSKAIEVVASGKLVSYGANAPHEFEGENCSTCKHAKECTDYYEYDKKLFNSKMYTPDLCIYSPDIDIEDNFSASILFENGVFATYSLCAHANYEGEVIYIEGEKGRIEARQTHVFQKGDDKDLHNDKVIAEESIKIFRFGVSEAEIIEIPKVEGAHGGADALIMEDLFGTNISENKPTFEDGIQAVLTGSAIVESMKSGKKVYVQELL